MWEIVSWMFAHICECPNVPLLCRWLSSIWARKALGDGLFFLQKGWCPNSSFCLATSTYRCSNSRELAEWWRVPQREETWWQPQEKVEEVPEALFNTCSVQGLWNMIGKRSGQCMPHSAGPVWGSPGPRQLLLWTTLPSGKSWWQARSSVPHFGSKRARFLPSCH